MSAIFNSNLAAILNDLDGAMRRAADAIGDKAEGYAKDRCPHDTGLLRNSITHGLAGEAPAISSYADDGDDQHGEYSGEIPKGSGDKYVIVVGTNVEYAPYNEFGTGRKGEHGQGRGVVSGMPARPFIRPAIESHKDEYRHILESELKKG